MPHLPPLQKTGPDKAHLIWQGHTGDAYSNFNSEQRIVAVLLRDEIIFVNDRGEEKKCDAVRFLVEIKERDAMGAVQRKTTEHLTDAASMAIVGVMTNAPAWLSDWYQAQLDRPVREP